MLASIDENETVHIISDIDATHMLRWAKTYNEWKIQDRVGKYLLSTVFLGIEQNNGMYFETAVIFDDTCDIKQRYATAEEARKGHSKWLGLLVI